MQRMDQIVQRLTPAQEATDRAFIDQELDKANELWFAMQAQAMRLPQSL